MSAVPLAIKTEEVILENAEYNSAEELDEELQLQLEDSGGENTYHIEYTTEPAHQVTSNSQRRQSNMTGGNGSNNAGGSNTPKGGGAAGERGGGGGDGGCSPGGSSNKPMPDNEKRMRREIANSNERRRMQSINTGFQNLRGLLPRHEGEKLSKAAILQQTFQYILELENQKTQLLTQNSELKRQVGEHEGGGGGGGGNDGNYETNGGATGGGSGAAVAIKKRKLTDNVINIQTISDSSDEGLGSMSPEPMTLLSGGTGAAAAAVATTVAANKLNNASIIAAKELLETKKQLDKERSMRRLLEDELQMIKRQLYSVATAPPGTAVAAVGGTSTAYIPREVIEHTDNFVRADELDDLGGTVSYVEIDEMTGQQQVVVCSSIEELEADAAAEIITEDQVHEEVILSSNSSTESENEVNVNAIAKAYAEGSTPNAAMLQPILQAAIKATPKVEVERIHDKLVKVKTEKLEHHLVVPSNSASTTTVAVAGFTRSRQNLETIVEAIRHLEGDHLFADGEQHHHHQQQQQQQYHRHHQQQQSQQHHQHHQSQQHQQQPQQHHHQVVSQRLGQDAPLALTTTGKQHAALAELRPFLHLKGNKQVIITTKPSRAAAAIAAAAAAADSSSSITGTPTTTTANNNSSNNNSSSSSSSGAIVTPTAIFKAGTLPANVMTSGGPMTITTSLKQCRPGVIVAKQLSSS